MSSASFEPSQLREFRAALKRDPALCARILASFPAVPQSERVTIRTDRASVDAAISKALALGVEGVETRIELQQ
jgi:hypothetical protein